MSDIDDLVLREYDEDPMSTIRAYLAAIGRKGGQSKSPRKAAQSRANGAKRKGKPSEPVKPLGYYNL